MIIRTTEEQLNNTTVETDVVGAMLFKRIYNKLLALISGAGKAVTYYYDGTNILYDNIPISFYTLVARLSADWSVSIKTNNNIFNCEQFNPETDTVIFKAINTNAEDSILFLSITPADDDLCNIVEFESAIGGGGTTYSLDEVDTGSIWIDGKKIYRKCFSLDFLNTNRDVVIVPYSELNWDSIVNVNTFLLINNKNGATFNYGASSNQNVHAFTSNSGDLCLWSSFQGHLTGYVEYTKNN